MRCYQTNQSVHLNYGYTAEKKDKDNDIIFYDRPDIE